MTDYSKQTIIYVAGRIDRRRPVKIGITNNLVAQAIEVQRQRDDAVRSLEDTRH